MPIPDHPHLTTRLLVKESVFHQLLGAILDGTLRPEERLHEAELVGWLGATRTPVRHAVQRLIDLGLVETTPARHVRVAPMRPRRALNALEVSVCMWQLAARLTLADLGADDLATVLDRHDQAIAACEEPRPRIHAVATSVHRAFGTLVKYAANPILDDVIGRAEIELAYQVSLVRRHVDMAAIAAAVERCRDSAARRDVAGLEDALESFLHDVAVPVLRRAAEEAR
ncbi:MULTISPECIES: GntR family transcriptional regulator [unclassified Isoptericola]|uniref:GntR family transcriptional regulator n=1 Tax=Isoptericola sp. NPDC057191 TaxID=3346041 RepID=UPI003625E6C9